MLANSLKKLSYQENLSTEESRLCLTEIFEGPVALAQMIELLTLLQTKGETVDEIVGFAQAMRTYMIPVKLPHPVLDLCGTGGSGKDRFNTSTAASFLAASLGIPVAKHGNKGSKKPNGSFDFIEKLGIPLLEEPQKLASIFQKSGLCFLFARHHHPAVSKVAQARKAIQGPTIFNLLGPLCNPASATHQLIGTTKLSSGEKLAKALQQLGTQRAFIIVNEEIDELSLQNPALLLSVTQTHIDTKVFDPRTISATAAAFQHPATVEENIGLFQDIVLNKKFQHPIAEMIALNAGLGLLCMEDVASLPEGFQKAQEAIENGHLANFFKEYIRLF